MSKISRSPYHGSRYVKRVINKDTSVRFGFSGDVLFIDVPAEGMTLSYDYVHEGCYNKMIIRESLGQLTINFSNGVSGVIIYDVGGLSDTIQSVTPQAGNSIVVPAGASDGSTFDLICDGSTWFIKGLVHGVQVTNS